MIGRPYQIPDSCFPSGRWPAKPDRFRVACYSETGASGGTYYGAVAFDHRTLKAAARRLAHIINRQTPPAHRAPWRGVRYDALYIVTPSGERLSLREAQARIEESADAS